ncbi:GAF and ANTAR domain-containing protein [Marisediminicola antarctica]|uniref:Transcriptional regulator n=1 Tax=Marisediminicola antarctica TaxID=674079 RepID=A0A7L5AH24_9MICO|nr:GAF and ANTAR domain-containing protein [Marisediminicola antarctica]QHO69577.1 transcriptional regulator [Marisediminicola antarctica]
MANQSREQKVSAAFVTVADTLIDDYDTVTLLQTLVEVCADILATDAGGLLLANSEGQLQLVASTSDRADLVEILQLDAGVGPCVDCFTTGKPVTVGDIAGSGSRWPVFREAALGQGFQSVHATPLRLRGTVLGAMNLFSTTVGELNDADIAVAQALADVATIGIIQERIVRDSGIVAEQLQRALHSRVLIEQAKGAVAQTANVSPENAFAVMRKFARDNNLTLSGVCEGVMDRTLEITNSGAATTAKLARK